MMLRARRDISALAPGSRNRGTRRAPERAVAGLPSVLTRVGRIRPRGGLRLVCSVMIGAVEFDRR